MLTDAEIQDLRAKARACQSRCIGRRVPVTFQGGPLDGMRVAVEAVAASTKRFFGRKWLRMGSYASGGNGRARLPPSR